MMLLWLFLSLFFYLPASHAGENLSRKPQQLTEEKKDVSQDSAPQSEAEVFQKSMLLYAQKDFLQSARLLRGLIMVQPQKSMYWFNFANCFYMLKYYDRALTYFNKVIALNTKFVEISKIYKAKTLLAMNQRAQAEFILRQVQAESTSMAYQKLSQVELENLQRLAAIEDSALEKYKGEDFVESEKILLAADENELSVNGRILLGLSYLKQAKKNQALKLFERLTRQRILNDEQKQLVSYFYKKIKDKGDANKPYWLSFDLSLASSDNIYIDGASLEPVRSNISKTEAVAGYHFFKDEKLSYKLGISLNSEEPSAAPELKIQNQGLLTGLLYENENLYINFSPFLKRQVWNGQSALQKIGFAFSFSEQLAAYEYGLEIDVVDKQALGAEFSYLKGTETTIRPFYGFWMNSWYSQIFFVVGFDPTSDINYGDGSRLPLNQIYNGFGFKTFWQISDENILQLNGLYVQRNFRNSALPSGDLRVDKELGLTLKYSYYFLPRTAIYATMDYTNNNSSLGAFDVRDKNYTTNVLSLGLFWDVFD